jgi:hypothetical protein
VSLALASVFEGVGAVVPEAVATGAPVIGRTLSIGPVIIRKRA